MTWRIGIIGAGAIARDHVQALAAIPELTVAHVVDRHRDRAEALARQAGTATWGTDLEAMLRDSSITAVDICTSPDSHAAITIAAARAGKAIHLEKPIALRPDEIEPMLDAVEQAGVLFLLGQTMRFQPVHLDIAAEIEAGTIGQPRAMHASFYAGHLWPGGWRAWQLQTERCGGHLVHNGIHAIDLATWLLGSTPRRVFARGIETFSPGMPTPDSFHVLLRFANGSMATLEWSYALQRRGDILRRIAIFGDRGALHHSTQGEMDIHSDATRPVAIATLDAFTHQMHHFVDVLDGATPLVTPEQMRGAFAAAHAAQESFSTGRAIEIGAVTGESAS